MRLRFIVSSLGTSVLVAGLVGSVVGAAPSTVYVGTTSCSNSGSGSQITPYCTIQKGVNSVANGGTVRISAGTYSEQVSIPSGKNNITLRGAGNNTIIKAPSSLTAGGIIVDNSAKGLTLEDLSVSGPFQAAGCNDNEYGVYFENGSSGTISDSSVVNIEDANVALRGCQQAIAIRAGQQSTSKVASITVVGTTITGYQKGAIVVDNTGSNGVIERNTITGYGPVSFTAQNGIQISRGATATVTQNKVSGNEYTGDNGVTTATGILLYQAGKVTISQNTANSNDVGFDVDTMKSSFSQNTANNNTTNGFYIEPTSYKDTFTQNSAKNNSGSNAYTPYDMQDTSTGSGTLGTANTWHQNGCLTSDPALLCKQ